VFKGLKMIVTDLLAVRSPLLNVISVSLQTSDTGPRPEPDTSIFNPSVISVLC